jgi:serine/threonine-protein kinase
VLYEALTGQQPFTGDTTPRLIAAHLHDPPPRPSIARRDVPAPVDDVIATGMAKDPDQRYATTVELATAAHDAITVPIQKSTADPTRVRETQPAPTRAAEPATVRAAAAAPTKAAVSAKPSTPTRGGGIRVWRWMPAAMSTSLTCPAAGC